VSFRGFVHGAKLQDVERFSVFAHAHTTVEHRSGRFFADADCHIEEKRREKEKTKSRAKEIQGAFEDLQSQRFSTDTGWRSFLPVNLLIDKIDRAAQ